MHMPTPAPPCLGLRPLQVRRVIDDMRRDGQSIDVNLVVDRLARE